MALLQWTWGKTDRASVAACCAYLQRGVARRMGCAYSVGVAQYDAVGGSVAVGMGGKSNAYLRPSI